MIRKAILGCALLIALGSGRTGWCQESVPVPRSRLEELERKEAELERLKGQLNKKPQETAPRKTPEKAPKVEVQAAPQQVSPPLNSLPPLAEGETITLNASDLAEHYRLDPVAADARYRKRALVVKGEIVGFEVPPFLSQYKIILKTADPQLRVVCQVARPEKYTAVIKTELGSVLVGLIGGQTREPIARVGQMAVVEGRCAGRKEAAVALSRCQLSSVTEPGK